MRDDLPKGRSVKFRVARGVALLSELISEALQHAGLNEPAVAAIAASI